MAQTSSDQWPVPLWPLWRNQSYRALNSAGVGIVLRLVEHYWLTGCRPFGMDDPTILSVSRGHKATYVANREDILKAFEGWRPIADAYYRKRQGNHAGLSAAGKTSTATSRLNAISKRHTAPETPSAPRILSPPQRTQDSSEAKLFTD